MLLGCVYTTVPTLLDGLLLIVSAIESWYVMQGVTPLHAAARYDNVTAVGWLLRHDADLDAKDNKVRSDMLPVSVCKPCLCLISSVTCLISSTMESVLGDFQSGNDGCVCV